MATNLQFDRNESHLDSRQVLAELIDVRDIPPLPEVALKVMQYAESDTSNATEIGQIISRDQGLTGQILKIANSAFVRHLNIRLLHRLFFFLGQAVEAARRLYPDHVVEGCGFFSSLIRA